MRKKKSIGTQEAPGRRYNSGFAYIYLPTDVDREKYIQNCFRTKTVTIIDENGQVQNRIPIDKEKLNYINFPDSLNELGSPILWQNIKPYNSIVITNVFEFGDEFKFQDEQELILNREKGENVAEISLNGGEGRGVFSFFGSDRGGELEISVKNQEKTGKLKVEVFGDYENYVDGNINTELTNQIKFRIFDPEVDDKETTFKYKKGEGFSYVDEFENEWTVNKDYFRWKHNKGKTIELNDKISLGSKGGSAEAGTLGDTCDQVLTNITTEVDKLNTALQTFASAQQGVVGSLPYLVPMSAAYGALNGQLASITPQLKKFISAEIKKIKSKVVTLD